MAIRLEDLPQRLQVAARAQLAAEDARARIAAETLQAEFALPGVPAAAALVAPEDKGQRRAEVQTMHVPLRQWLNLHRLPHVYHRPDKASGIRVGWPDFTVFYGGRVAAVEFKAPGGRLRPEQSEVKSELELAGIPYLIAYTLADGIAFLKTTLAFDPLADTVQA